LHHAQYPWVKGEKGKAHHDKNYKKFAEEDNNIDIPYDVWSIMNYPTSASADDIVTSLTDKGLRRMYAQGMFFEEGIGHVKHLSPLDAIAINQFYGLYPNVKYEGCYEDKPAPNRDMKLELGYGYTPHTCAKACVSPQYQAKYISLQNGGQCFCGQNGGQYVSKYGKHLDEECDTMFTRGGGPWRNAVFSIQGGRPYAPPRGPYAR
jgi:hypothetical protein